MEEKVKAFQALIEQLPILHQYLLLYLLDLLCLFSLYSENTRMDLSSLATAFAPVRTKKTKQKKNVLIIIYPLGVKLILLRLYYQTQMMQ